MSTPQFDAVIVGSGIVGLTAALALARNSSLKIAIIEAKSVSAEWQADKIDARVSAISIASRKIFQNLQVWESICRKRISPYTTMEVWDGNGNGEINFDCRDVGEAQLGYIIEDSVMRTSLLTKIQQYQTIQLFSATQLTELNETTEFIELTTADQQTIRANLLIAADGAHSWVREQLNIALKSWDYAHTAIVTTVKTELPHQKSARQLFLPTGPLAFLPLQDEHTCSIVWSAVPDFAEKLLSFDDETFKNILSEAFQYTLGDVVAVEPRLHFPLHMRHAKEYTRTRLALIGDAAHTIHPLAGQGVNMGLLDAVCLAEVVQDAIDKNRDFSSAQTLRRYERWRKSDNITMLATVDILRNLFASDRQSVKSVRNVGLNLADKTLFVKNYLTNYALGKRGDLPRLAEQCLQ